MSNTMEAGLGAIWGEDPRYIRDAGAPFSHRIGHAVKMTFMAQNRDGKRDARLRPIHRDTRQQFPFERLARPGDNSADRAAIRTGLGFLGRLGNNTFDEFWPDFKQKLFHRTHSD